ncbi:MAG: glycosyltransferase family 39 protein [Candidatus Latescibacteria bacterium]|nr:glycosyltransferase family 39 protein [Candidatus Latescibacterota bacterium]
MVELIYICLLGVVAVGFGRRVLRWLGISNYWLAEELAFSFGLGLGALALGVLVLGLTHLLYEGSLYLLVLACGVAGSRELLGVGGRLKSRVQYGYWQPRSYYFWIPVLALAGFSFNLLRALTPAWGAVDPLAYHLALPALYLKKHYLSFEPTITGTMYPDNIGMLYTLAIGLRGAVLAQLVHLAMAVGTALALIGFCRRFFDLRVGLWAAVIFSSLPVVVFFAPLGYIDVGVCLFQFLGCWALFNWLEERDRKMLLLAAVFIGLSLGAKHTAIPLAVLGLAIVVVAEWRRASPAAEILRRSAWWVGVVLLLAGPWYLRALVVAGNPVWPIANSVFAGFPYYSVYNAGGGGGAGAASAWLPSWERLQEQLFVSATSLWKWSMAPGDLQKAIGGYLIVLLPGLLLYARSRRVLLLTAFCAVNYLVLVLYIGGVPRYNLYLFALLSVLAGYVAERLVHGAVGRWRWVFQAVFALTLVCNLAWGYYEAHEAVEYHLSGKSDEQFLAEHEGNYRVFQAVNRQLPEDAVVLLQGLVQGYYCDRPYLWDHPYQRVINYHDYATPEALYARMKALGISHVVRLINVPGIRINLGYPQYFADPFHEAFRRQYLKLLYRDESYALFELSHGANTEP